MRTVTIDFNTAEVCGRRTLGFIGEHNATELVIIPPRELEESEKVTGYAAAFTTDGRVIRSRTYQKGEELKIPLWQQLTQASVLGVQLEAFDSDGEFVGKSAFIPCLRFLPSADGTPAETDTENSSVLSEIAANTAARRRIHIGADEPADPNVDIWINPDGEKGTGYPVVRTVTVKCTSEGFVSYLSVPFNITRVCIRKSATEKLIPPNAKILGIDFVIDGEHYFNSEIKMCNNNTKNLGVNLEFFPCHNEHPDASVQNIAQIAGQDSSSIVSAIEKNLTEFTVYYYEMNESVAVIKARDENGNWQYVATTTGEKGDTPIKGVDYWTTSDKQEIINATLELMPKWSGEAYY